MSNDVIVVGAGVIGLALARELHRQGLSVMLLEAGAAGQGASWAAAGMLWGYQTSEPALRPLAIASARLYPTWASELEAETYLPSGYHPSGTLFLASPGHAAPAPTLPGWERLLPEQLQACEPGLRPVGAEAWRIAGDHSVDNRLLLAALLASVRGRGLVLHEHQPVRAIQATAAGLAVTTPLGTHTARHVVNAAGAWAAAFAAPVAAPVRPCKGQMLSLLAPDCPRHIIAAAGAYLVPRADGRTLIGATLEDAGFDTTVAPAAIAALRRRAEALFPALAQAGPAESWAGLRPASADELPLIGPTPCPGYWMATGHFRDGILLAPITAKILAHALATGHMTQALDLAPFLPARFAPSAPGPLPS
ncbi:MAG TPA: glycine oxidase ThiO [Terriglobales bacterium]|nr:glycine oxidase ThiO [Terriglobales bacterium]